MSRPFSLGIHRRPQTAEFSTDHAGPAIPLGGANVFYARDGIDSCKGNGGGIASDHAVIAHLPVAARGRGSLDILPFQRFLGTTSATVPVLAAAPFRGPVDKPPHVFAVLPGETEKLACGQVGRFFSKKRFKTPAHVRTLPRPQAITSSGVPVVAQCLKHFSPGAKSRLQIRIQRSHTEELSSGNSTSAAECGRALRSLPIDPGTEACGEGAQTRAGYDRAICAAVASNLVGFSIVSDNFARCPYNSPYEKCSFFQIPFNRTDSFHFTAPG